MIFSGFNCGFTDELLEANFDFDSVFTIEFWFKKSGSFGDFEGLVAKRDNIPFTATLPCNYGFNINSEVLQFYSFFHPGDGVYNCTYSTSNIATETWHHVAGSMEQIGDSVEIKLYFNGLLVDEQTYQFQLSDNLNDGEFNIGASTCLNPILTTFPFEPFVGMMDEVRVWNSIRTAAEIENHMNVKLSGREEDLLAYYKMDIEDSICDIESCEGIENHANRTSAGSMPFPEYVEDVPFTSDQSCEVDLSCNTLPVERS
ncbi:MAG: LamG domain-containing protein, partial [Bacteroidota bacterium]